MRVVRVMLVLSVLSFAGAALAQSADQEVVSAIDSPDPVTPGATLSYTVTIRNNGPDPATNGGLNINLPGALAHTTDVVPPGWTCFWAGSNGTCNTPSFAAGTTEVITINTTVNASLAAFPDQSITATFSPSGTTPDPNAANNSKSATTAVDSPQVDLSVTAFDSPDPVIADGNVTYSVTVTNGGPDTASNVNFNVVPNASLRFQGVTIPAGWTCTLPAVGATNATFTCSRATWAPGSETFTIVFSAEDEQLGTTDSSFQSSFSVNAGGSNETDVTDNQTDVTTSYVTPDADVTLSVTDSPDPVAPDGNITYTVTVGNAGPDTAPNLTLTLFGSNNLRFVSATLPAGWNCTLPAPGAQTAGFTCTNVSGLASGASSVLTFVLQAADELIGTADTTILLGFSADSSVSDPDSSNNGDTESTAYVAPDADLSVTATDAPDPAAAGSNITYSGTVSSAGPDAASSVTLSALLDPSVLFVSATVPAGFSCVTPAVGSSGNVTCTIATLASGASLPFTVVGQIDPTLTSGPDGAVQSTFTINSLTNDPAAANNSVDVTTTYSTPDADLSLSKSTTTSTSPQGVPFDYTITLTNNGPDTADAVVLTDVFPASLLFRSITAPAGWTCTTPAAGTNGTITCNTSSLPNGASATFTLTVESNASSGTVTNTASGTSATVDPNAGNSSASATPVTLAPSSADLSIAKNTSATSVANGSLLDYTIAVSNAGPATATNVVVTDALPPSLELVSATPSQGTCSGTTTVTCNLGAIANGSGVTIALQTRVVATSGTVTNSATVAATEDAIGASTSTPPIPVTAPATPIPTLSGWLLMLMAATLAVAAMMRMR